MKNPLPPIADRNAGRLHWTRRCRTAALWLVAILMIGVVPGCSGIQRHEYVFWGDIVPEHPESLQDHWTDCGPFLPHDRSMKMRRGKAGVLRFYKKKNYDRSIPVDGELVVYVFKGNGSGVELTEPEYKLIVSAEQLNRQRKFDKENGYSYHIWLDLGEVDLPPESISILSVFTENKTHDQVESGITYTQIGSEPTGEVKGSAEFKDVFNATKTESAARPVDESAAKRISAVRTGTQEVKESEALTDAIPDYALLGSGAANGTPVGADAGQGANVRSGLTLNLSDSMMKQMETSPSPVIVAESSKSLELASPARVAQNFPTSAPTSGSAPVSHPLPAAGIAPAGNVNLMEGGGTDSTYHLAPKKLTFDEMRSIGSPDYENQSYFTRRTNENGMTDTTVGSANPVTSSVDSSQGLSNWNGSSAFLSSYGKFDDPRGPAKVTY